MHLIRKALAILAVFAALGQQPARAAATLLPNAEQCFQATAGTNGMVGLLGTITGGTGGTTGSYGGVALTGGSGTSATANITVAGGAVTAVVILNPGSAYVVGDVLSAASGNIGGTTGFSVPVSSVSINSSLAGGSVAFYIPLTNTFKQTWNNADQAGSHLNTNPVTLDANGCAIIYGIGSYRQVVKDSLGNTVWDQITTDTSANGSIFWAGTAGGTPNVITIVDAGFNATDGTVIQFLPLSNNTGSATLNPSGFGAIPILKASSSGPVALAAGDLVAGYTANVVYIAATNSFQLLNPAPSTSATTALPPPQGRLTLTSGTPVISSDVNSATIVYYTPYVGNQIPIYNGSAFVTFTFSELTLTLTGSHLANTIYDVCIFSNSGSATAVTTPAWSNSTPGAGARGSGAGSAQLQRTQGFMVNAVAVTGTNGASTFSIPVNQCTYVGSIYTDGAAGQVSAHVTYGQNRKFGVWNAYSRVPIYLKAGDPTASWGYAVTKAPQASNNVPAAYASHVCNAGSGTTCNGLVVLSGLAEEIYDLELNQGAQVLSGTNAGNFTSVAAGIGLNSITVFSGVVGSASSQVCGANCNTRPNMVAHSLQPPSLGLNNVIAMEAVPFVGTAAQQATFFGGENGTVPVGAPTGAMILSARWRG